MREAYSTDGLRRWYCRDCEMLYVLWGYQVWRWEYGVDKLGAGFEGQVRRLGIG